ERAFGGPNFPANPAGKGLDADNKTSGTPPNLEDPDHLPLSGMDKPAPACPFPLDMANPVRRALSGTYDQRWLDTRWPAYPDDCDPEFFHSAQAVQRLRPAQGETPFFRGDDASEITGMSHEYPHIRSRLPEARIRAFVRTTEKFVPFAPAQADESTAPEQKNREKTPLPYAKDLDGPGLFREVELRLDTVWLLPDLLGAFVLRRGLLQVEDDELDDVLRVLVVTEKPSEAPKTLEYYMDELRKRAYPAVEIDLAPFVAAQAKTTKTVKMARDVPKLLAKVKKDFLGQNPVAPLSLGDIAHSTQKTLATSRATLDKLERQVLAQREQFSHLMSFDLSMFPKMRATLNAQEQNLEKTLRHAEEQMSLMDKKVKESVASMKAKGAKLLQVPPDAAPGDIAAKGALNDKLRAKLAELDKLTPAGVLCTPPKINPWHDRGFPLLLDARRALRRDDALPARLAAMGLEPKTLENAWIGHAVEALQDSPENWGLPLNPAAPEFFLPGGLYVPRFKGRALVALRVYPVPDPEPDHEQGLIRGLGTDAAAIALAPGSDEKTLSLPAAHPGGAVVAAPEDLSALFAEQELGDFCHIVAASNPETLAAVEDLPPLASSLTPDVPEEKGGLPLLVILPPLPEGRALFGIWRKACPTAIPLYLPEGCPHVLALAQQGHRLRRLALDVLPRELAKVHDFDFPLPPKDKPPQPFTLNLPLPSKEELQGQIDTLIKDIRAHFPDPQQLIAETWAKQKPLILAKAAKLNPPPEMLAKLKAALDKPIPPPEKAPTVAEATKISLDKLAGMKTRIPATVPPEMKAKILASLEEAEARTRALGARLAPLDALREEGLAKIAAFKKGELPKEIQAAFDAKGMDPMALKLLSREEVEAMLAKGESLTRKNMRGLDLSGLNFSGADLSHALCAKTNFQGCCMDGADFTFTLANEADFTGASFHGAVFKQTVLQKAVLRKADFSDAGMELTTLGECDCSEAVFDRAQIKLCNFTKAALDKTRFTQTTLSLCAFNKVQAAGADFCELRAFKCLFNNARLDNALFRKAVLSECLFQSTAATGISMAGAELRKFYTDADTDLSNADFSGADLREASLRLSRMRNADFYKANLENALITQCDLSRARLDGLRAVGCRFIKCDLTGADLSGTNLMNGALKKCRLTGADLSGSNFYAADLSNIVIGKTDFSGANLRRTRLEGQKEVLTEEAPRYDPC
ncbi:MAG: pentapeptide repeat-containing protein, partial [Desulfovibrio sp.]|nr:pentapeptide repeat-containing protein [Desulfovibrio sp.]